VIPISAEDFGAIRLTLRLAGTTTLVLLCLATPLAWWLARSGSRWSPVVGAVVALPLVLPPTVLGFYLLVSMGPQGAVGRLTQWLGVGLLPFTFSGLVVGSVLFSLPFAVQPLQNAFEQLGDRRWRLPPPCVHRRGTRFGMWCCRCAGPALSRRLC